MTATTERENAGMPRALALVGNLGDAQRKAMRAVADTDLCDFPRRNLLQLWFEYAGASREPLLAGDMPQYRAKFRAGVQRYRELVAQGYRPTRLVTGPMREAA